MPTRLDQALVERGLCDSREKAKRFILARQVRINGQSAKKPSDSIREADELTLEASDKFVSRGGHKLEHALEHFQIEVKDCVAIDIGASTGGFTDCLLQRGAQKVFAVDVGQGQLAWKLRQDSRVVVMEKTNARFLRPEQFLAKTEVRKQNSEGSEMVPRGESDQIRPNPSKSNQIKPNQTDLDTQGGNGAQDAVRSASRVLGYPLQDVKSGGSQTRGPGESDLIRLNPTKSNQKASQGVGSKEQAPGGKESNLVKPSQSNLTGKVAGTGTDAVSVRPPEPPADLVVADCSFISLTKILPAAIPLVKAGGKIVALIKPQFEAGKAEVDKGRGVITDTKIHERVLMELRDFVAAQAGVCWRGVVESPLLGPAGNKEFLALIEKTR
jgi:predicted rRNA methylase YqxC with S4 and FtsJ domains